MKRTSTKYPGVTTREAAHPATGKPDVAFYIRYRRAGKLVEERLGWRSEGWTPARASQERAARIAGAKLSNEERRNQERAEKAAQDARWTLNRLWTEYAAQRPAGHSLITDAGRYKKHVAPALGDKTPDELLTLDTDRLRLKLLKSHSPQTTKHVLGIIKRVIRFGVRAGLVDPPSPRRLSFRMPSFDNTRTETLSDEQLAALLKAAAEDENWKARALVKMALATGMRKSEMLWLRWQDIGPDFIVLHRTKAGRVQRVPLNDMAREVLDHLPRNGDLLFPGDKAGQPVRNLYPALRRIRKRAGLPDSVRPLHALRHVFASRLASAGESLFVVQKLLRHGDGRMTQRYAHLADEALVRAADRAGRIMEQAEAVGNVLQFPDKKAK